LFLFRGIAKPVVDDALAQINRNPLNKFQDQLDATANNPELKDSVKQVENDKIQPVVDRF
jgi:hypothetical protein